MTDDPQAPYERLLALGICQLELAKDGRLTELAACQAASAELMSTLPDTPPAQAQAALQRCLLLEQHLEAELTNARQAALKALGDLRRAQRAATGYTPVRQRFRVVSADA
jgi:hypothetical protein